MKTLIDGKADIHAEDDEALRYASYKGHFFSFLLACHFWGPRHVNVTLKCGASRKRTSLKNKH